MSKQNFKKGDKVRVANPSEWKHPPITGVVIRIDDDYQRNVYVEYDAGICMICGDANCPAKVNRIWYYSGDLTPVADIGKQLMLFDIK